MNTKTSFYNPDVRFFYPNDDLYFVICKKGAKAFKCSNILTLYFFKSRIEGAKVVPDSFTSEEYDHQFFYQFYGENFSVSCVIYSLSLTASILNKEMFGLDINVNNMDNSDNSRRNKLPLSLHHKLQLENSLKQVLPSYLSKNQIFKSEMRSNSDGIMNDIISYQDVNVHVHHPHQQVDFNNNQHHQQFFQHYVSNIETSSSHGDIEDNISMARDINQNYNDIGLSSNDHFQRSF
ncbi:7408_t:CDS:2 [Funneliformis geosporum]|nr:7408_t:CDS:2 [Funneliformis geosporum]